MMTRARFATSVAFVISIVAVSCGGSTSGTTTDGGLFGSSDGGPGIQVPDGGPCTSDSNCARPTPYCNTTNDRCVECLGDPNCGNGSTCNLTTNTCVQCTTDAQCGGATPYCSPAGNCVQCTSAGNCGTNQTCDTTRYRCVRSCTTDAQCAQPTSHCNTTTDRCVQCLASSDCPGGGGAGGTPICDTTTDDCVQCVTNADCKNGARPLCDPTAHACVQCLSKTDCDSGVCNFAGICGPG